MLITGTTFTGPLPLMVRRDGLLEAGWAFAVSLLVERVCAMEATAGGIEGGGGRV